MGKIRVYELAKELDMESKDVIRRLGKMGAEVKNHMSTVEDKYVQMLRDIMRPKLILEQKSAEHPSKPEHTKERMERLARNCHVDYLLFGEKNRLGQCIGKSPRNAVLVSDKNFAAQIL